MKRLVILFTLSLFSQFINAKYLICENGEYVTKEWANDDLSFNDVASHLGYTSEQYFTYRDRKIDSPIRFVMMELITSKIIFLLVNDGGAKISQNDVDYYLKNYSYKEMIRPHDYADRIQSGVDSHNFSIRFFIRTLGIDCDENCKDTTIVDNQNQYKYIFKDGILFDFVPTDGLGRWARFYKDGNYFPIMKEYAESYWKGNKKKVIWEINIQSNALAKIPKGFDNDYCYLFAEYDDRVFNAKIMNVALYGDTDLTEQEFVDITHNSAKNDGLMSYYGKNCKRYCYKDFYFLFDSKGKFYKVVEKD